MNKMKRLLLVTVLVPFLNACAPSSPSPFDETQEGFFVAGNIEGFSPSSLSTADQDLYHHVGLSMLVEQYETQNLSSMRAAIAQNPMAGVVFWNPQNVGAQEIGAITRAYGVAAQTAAIKQPPLLFSTDYEGGGLSRSIKGANIPGIQRFKKGFTLFPHGQWLGKEIQDLNSDELCSIQGEVMGKELLEAGINYPLATVSDLQGGLFINRSISTDPQVVARCLNIMMDKFNEASQGKAIFVTKHFPGLGFTHGDTHEMTVISDRRGAEFDRHILPYRLVLAQRRTKGTEDLMSVMVGHAQFTAFSPTHTSTESSYILKTVLKGNGPFQEQDGGVKTAHQGLGFSGLVLSDAMWMGVYGFVHQMATIGRITEPGQQEGLKSLLVREGLYSAAQVQSLTSADYQRVYNVLSLNTLVAGMDILMVPNVQFAKLVLFLRKGVAGQWDNEEKRLVAARTGVSAEQAQVILKNRLTEIIAKNRRIRAKLVYPVAMNGNPADENISLSQRLHQVLHALDAAWNYVAGSKI
jgi:beta-glucosidase-like glycosyl hydrolase